MGRRSSFTKKAKEQLLEALKQNLGIVSAACRACNISRKTYYEYYNTDPDFADKADDVVEMQKDFGESALFKKMKDGDTAAIIFFAKTRLKDRGYIERREITGKDGSPLSVTTQDIDTSVLTDGQREALLSLGEDILKKQRQR